MRGSRHVRRASSAEYPLRFSPRMYGCGFVRSRAQVEGKLAEQIAFYAKPKLLVVDEFGSLPLEKQTANLFFQLVSRRYERGSMLITTNQTITQWGHVFGDEVIAAAVLDRVLHHSHILIIQGDSFRLRQKKRAGLLGSSKAGH